MVDCKKSIILTGEQLDVEGVCGICGSYIETFDLEYSCDNVMYWCQNCTEVLLCASTDDLGVYENCAVPLHQEEIEICVGANGLLKPELTNGKLCAVGILKFKLFYVTCLDVQTESGEQYTDSDSDTEDDEVVDKCLAKIRAIYAKGREANTDKRAVFVPEGVSVYTFSQAREVLQDSLSHDGVYLYYVGVCSCCGREYTSWICGD